MGRPALKEKRSHVAHLFRVLCVPDGFAGRGEAVSECVGCPISNCFIQGLKTDIKTVKYLDLACGISRSGEAEFGLAVRSGDECTISLQIDAVNALAGRLEQHLHLLRDAVSFFLRSLALGNVFR